MRSARERASGRGTTWPPCAATGAPPRIRRNAHSVHAEGADLHDLAARLGLKRGRGGDKALYHSPQHEDKSPSRFLSFRTIRSTARAGATTAPPRAVRASMVMHARGCTVADSVRFLHEAYGMPFDRPAAPAERREKSTDEYIADRCLSERARVLEYLAGRGISEAAIKTALNAKTLGYNDWTSSKVARGEVGHGGPAAAFVVRAPTDGRPDCRQLGLLRIFFPQTPPVDVQPSGFSSRYGCTLKAVPFARLGGLCHPNGRRGGALEGLHGGRPGASRCRRVRWRDRTRTRRPGVGRAA
jgi:hypothetical protein